MALHISIGRLIVCAKGRAVSRFPQRRQYAIILTHDKISNTQSGRMSIKSVFIERFTKLPYYSKNGKPLLRKTKKKQVAHALLLSADAVTSEWAPH